MKKWRKKLLKAFDTNQLVRFERLPEIEDTIEGYVVGTSEGFVLLHIIEPDSMTLNGYIALRCEDIRRYKVMEDSESFLHRALQAKGIAPVAQPAVDMSSIQALISSIDAAFPLFTIHCELQYPYNCFIGRVNKMTPKSVWLDEINPAAEWKRTRKYKFKDITRLDFGGGYEAALALVSPYTRPAI